MTKNNIQGLDFCSIIKKMIDGELALSTFTLPMRDENELKYGNKHENVLMKAMYMQSPYSKEILNMIQKAPLNEEDLTKKNFAGFTVVHLAILNGKVEEAQVILDLMIKNRIEIIKTNEDMSILQLAVLSNHLPMIQLIEHYDNDIHYSYSGDGQSCVLDLALESFDNQEIAEYVVNMYSMHDIMHWMNSKNFGSSDDDFDPFDVNFRPLKLKNLLNAICEKKILDQSVHQKGNSVKKIKV